MSSKRPAATSCSVTARSSAEGAGSPLGWLCTRDDRRRPLGDRLPKHLARMYEGRVQNPACHRDVALQPVLRVEHGDVELLDGQVFHPRSEVLDDVSRRLEPGSHPAGLDRHAPPKLQRRVNRDRASHSYPGNRPKRRHGLASNPAQRPAGFGEDRMPDLERAAARAARPEQDGEQLRAAQRASLRGR